MDHAEILLTRERCASAHDEAARLFESVGATMQRVRDGHKHALEATTRLVDVQREPHQLMISRLGRLSATVGRSPAIEDAKGALAAQYGITRGQAFEIMRQVSIRSNRKLREVAEEMHRVGTPAA